jgi:hypothetical protein
VTRALHIAPAKNNPSASSIEIITSTVVAIVVRDTPASVFLRL